MSVLRTISDVRNHTKADRLDVAQVGGYQVVVPRGQYLKGDKVVHFIPETEIPQELAEELGILGYLDHQLNLDGVKVLKTTVVTLRGEYSQGFIASVTDDFWLEAGGEGYDVHDLFGTKKFYPQARRELKGGSKGHTSEEVKDFPRYHALSNARDIDLTPLGRDIDLIPSGTPISITEKIHGTNSRVGFVREKDSNGNDVMRIYAGSRRMNVEPSTKLQKLLSAADTDRADLYHEFEKDLYWSPLASVGVLDLLYACYAAGFLSVTIYGEIYGGNTQKGFNYGLESPEYRAFDIRFESNGRVQFLNPTSFRRVTEFHSILTVPVITIHLTMPQDVNSLKKWIPEQTQLGGTHISEGIVIRPLEERTDSKGNRVVLKLVSDEFLLKNDKKGTTDV